METDLYTEQLRTALGDLLAVAKPKALWRGKVWDERVARSKRLLERRRPILTRLAAHSADEGKS